MQSSPTQRPPGYLALLRMPGAAVFFVATVLGRVPLAMRPLGAILLVESLTGSYGLAGTVGATTTLVGALAAPRLGALTDRIGDRPVLIWTAFAHAAGIGGLIAVAHAGLPGPVLVACAVVMGASTVPFPSLSRARWAATLGPGPAQDKAQAMESIADELGFVVGPIVVVWLALSVSPAVGLLSVLAFVVVASVVVAAQPPRQALATDDATAIAGTVIGDRGMQVLVAGCFFLGLIFGAVELMMVAFADDRGSPGAASYLVAAFALGSMVSALATGGITWRVPAPRRFVLASVILAAGTVPLLLASTIPVMLVAVFAAGLAIAPALIAANSVVEGLAPRHRLNEAFAWLGGSIASGAAGGTIAAGVVIDAFGARGGQSVAVVAGGLTMLVVLAGSGTLQRRRPLPD